MSLNLNVNGLTGGIYQLYINFSLITVNIVFPSELFAFQWQMFMKNCDFLQNAPQLIFLQDFLQRAAVSAYNSWKKAISAEKASIKVFCRMS